MHLGRDTHAAILRAKRSPRPHRGRTFHPNDLTTRSARHYPPPEPRSSVDRAAGRATGCSFVALTSLFLGGLGVPLGTDWRTLAALRATSRWGASRWRNRHIVKGRRGRRSRAAYTARGGGVATSEAVI